MVWLARYKAWGRIHKLDKNDVRQPLRFQGQYEDEETGLYYNRYRYYDPDGARFLTQDPIGLAGGVNLYQYAPNPIKWIDPLGLSCAVIPKGKLDYLFGRATGRQHNIDRSHQNAAQMKRLGIDDNPVGHAILYAHLKQVGSSGGNVTQKFTNEYGVFEVKESLIAGPSGKFAQFETTWKVDPDGCRTLTTVIPKGGRRKADGMRYPEGEHFD